MKILNGICGSSGYARGVAAVKRAVAVKPEKRHVTDPAGEERRFREAQGVCGERIARLIEESEGGNSEITEIFKAYKTILGDEVFFRKALKRLEPEMLNIEYILYDECEKAVSKLAGMDDPYLKERAVDIENVCNEIIRALLGLEQDFALQSSSHDIVVVAEDLTPAETMKMDKTRLRGFVTEKGGATSHTVILAKALGIPAIIGAAGALEQVNDGDILLLDAFKGSVTVNPGAEQEAVFKTVSERFERQRELLEKSAGEKAVTQDGLTVCVNINTGDDDSIGGFDPEKCDGIGLLRTEFLYMSHSDYPTEEDQYAVYGEIAKKARGKEVIIRTLDIGGDKQLGYMDLPNEENPFLGYRAIRLCLDRKEVFHTQLRAILRASAHGNVKIMFPMIINMEELLAAKECVEKAKRSLDEDGLEYNPAIQVGIMIETPAAALLSGKLAKESDFFSVGSNDLIQYITATDRMNERVQHLYDSCNLSVLNAIRMVSESAAAAGIPWGICGEVASEEKLVPLFAALKVNELSVAPSLVGKVKDIIRRSDAAELLPAMTEILDMSSAAKARQALDDILARLSLVRVMDSKL